MILKRYEYIVVDTAENGKIAVDMISKNIDMYTCIMMDNIMPVMNGIDATKILRKKGFSNIIIGITGNVMDDDIHNYLYAGADVVLSKPIHTEHIEMLLSTILKTGCSSYSNMTLIPNIDTKTFNWVPSKHKNEIIQKI